MEQIVAVKAWYVYIHVSYICLTNVAEQSLYAFPHPFRRKYFLWLPHFAYFCYFVKEFVFGGKQFQDFLKFRCGCLHQRFLRLCRVCVAAINSASLVVGTCCNKSHNNNFSYENKHIKISYYPRFMVCILAQWLGKYL